MRLDHALRHENPTASRRATRTRLGAGAVLLTFLSSTVTGCGQSAPPRASHPALEHMTALERGILQDKRVTAQEYRSAVDETVRCLTEHGFRVEDFATDPGTGLTSYNAAAAPTAPTPDQRARLDRVHERCEARKEAVEAVYVLQRSKSPEAAVAAVPDLLRCYRRSGVTLASTASPAEVARSVDQAVVGGDAPPAAVRACEATFRGASLQPLPGLATAWSSWEPR